MGNEKFTPGPWDVDKHCGQNQVHDSNCNFVACTYSGHFTAEQNTINAHLIAAAPDMYDVIDRLVPWLENDPNADSDEYCSFAKEMRRVLKKARGES